MHPAPTRQHNLFKANRHKPRSAQSWFNKKLSQRTLAGKRAPLVHTRDRRRAWDWVLKPSALYLELRLQLRVAEILLLRPWRQFQPHSRHRNAWTCTHHTSGKPFRCRLTHSENTAPQGKTAERISASPSPPTSATIEGANKRLLSWSWNMRSSGQGMLLCHFRTPR